MGPVAAGGGRGIGPVGTTGESPTLTHDERRQLIELAVKFARQRCQVVAGTGSNSTRDTLAHTREAQETGARGPLGAVPLSNQPTQQGASRQSGRVRT